MNSPELTELLTLAEDAIRELDPNSDPPRIARSILRTRLRSAIDAYKAQQFAQMSLISKLLQEAEEYIKSKDGPNCTLGNFAIWQAIDELKHALNVPESLQNASDTATPSDPPPPHQNVPTASQAPKRDHVIGGWIVHCEDELIDRLMETVRSAINK